MIQKTTVLLLIFLLFPLLVFSNNSDEIKSISSIGDLKWKNRILLVYEKEREDNFLGTLKEAQEVLNNRDIVWFLLKEGKITSNSRLSWDDGFFQHIEKMYFSNKKDKVLLIGKDGKTKSIGKELDLDYLNSLIDTMPMRRLEILQESSKD